MGRVYNFAAGPACMPEEVLREAADEMLDYRGTGMSVMEMSHRGKAYEEIIFGAEADIRALAGIPDDYAVLFLQGGATTQFAMVPMNLKKGKSGLRAQQLLGGEGRGTSTWTCASRPAKENYSRVRTSWALSGGRGYVHLPEQHLAARSPYPAGHGGVPLAADLSSASFPSPWTSPCGLITPGARTSALGALVIVRKDLSRTCPAICRSSRYATH